MLGNIFIGCVIVIYLIVFGKPTLVFIIKNNNSKNTEWLRKLFWTYTKQEIIRHGPDNYKVVIYLRNYLDKSVAIKHYFINNGYHDTKYILIGKIEELERFVEKYKYNTFDSLSDDEEDFIDRYNKQQKPPSQNSPLL